MNDILPLKCLKTCVDEMKDTTPVPKDRKKWASLHTNPFSNGRGNFKIQHLSVTHTQVGKVLNNRDTKDLNTCSLSNVKELSRIIIKLKKGKLFKWIEYPKK